MDIANVVGGQLVLAVLQFRWESLLDTKHPVRFLASSLHQEQFVIWLHDISVENKAHQFDEMF
jgi:hypothetical protein